MSLIFLNKGILTTVQDLGRVRFARFGINPNGAMDKTAARLINVLLGNDETEAVLEMHFPKPVRRADPFEKDKLGRLSLTLAGLRRRDELVLEYARAHSIPIVTVMSGGYAADIKDTVEIHCNTIRTVKNVFFSDEQAHNFSAR